MVKKTDISGLKKTFHKRKAKFDEEINELFDKLIKAKDERVSNFEKTKKNIIDKFDKKIDELYKKRDFIAEIIKNKAQLRKYRLSVWKKFWKNKFSLNIRFLLSAPFIYFMMIPIVFFHLTLEMYHHICFRLYGIPLVDKKRYFVFDRALLPYLNWIEKFNCFYCSYYNCLIAYAREIGARTERYWCPIKHARRVEGSHSEYDKFVDYSDAKNLRKKWKELRKFD